MKRELMSGQSRSLADVIRATRLKHQLTQKELARRLGVSQGTISFWENGIEAPTVENIIALALELPEVVEGLQGREHEMLQRILRLERELFGGRCACAGCNCGTDEHEEHVDGYGVGRSVEHSVRHSREEQRGMKIAIAGKGGVGKTTIAGTLARALAQEGLDVLALDSDSNPNLSFSLGLPPPEAERVPAVEHDLTEWREDERGHAYVHLRRPVSQLIADYGKPAPDGVQLLVMGEVLEASAGCRCSAHEVARGITGHLVTEADVVVLDMEPGLEHLGRGTTEHVDVLLIVVEPYYRALMAATRIQELAEQLELPHVAVVGNRVRSEQERDAIEQFCQNHDLDLMDIIPFDDAIVVGEQAGQAPMDYVSEGPAVQAIGELAYALRARLA